MRRYILVLGAIAALNTMDTFGSAANPNKSPDDNKQRTATKPQASMPKYEIQPGDILKRPRCKLLNRFTTKKQ